MCIIYSIAKISNLEHITFNTIIMKYSELFQSQEHVQRIYAKCVVNQDTLDTQDIISFYNHVFLKQMRNFVLLYKDQAKQAK